MTTLNKVKLTPANTANTDSELCQVDRQDNHHVFTKKMGGGVRAVESTQSQKKTSRFMTMILFSKQTTQQPCRDEPLIFSVPIKEKPPKSAFAKVSAPFTKTFGCVYRALSTKPTMQAECSPVSITRLPERPPIYTVACPVENAVLNDEQRGQCEKQAKATGPVIRIEEHLEFNAKQREQYRKQDEETFRHCLSF